MSDKQQTREWMVYILKCADDSLYTGITNNLNRRLQEHNQTSAKSKAAKYTRARQPVSLAYSEPASDRSTASRREYEIKQLRRADKLKLCHSQ